MLKASQALDTVEQIIPVFSPAPNAGGDSFNGLAEHTDVGPGRELLHKGKRAKYVRFDRSGVVKLTSMSDEGQESLSGLRSEGFWAGIVGTT